MKTPAFAQRGFTLLEALITVVVLIIAASLAIPALQELTRSNRVTAQTNELIALMHLARNEAIRRNPIAGQTVRVELDEDGAAGWSGAVFPPGTDETEAGCPVGAIRCASHTNVQLTGEDGLNVRFDNRGYSVTETGNLIEARFNLVHRDCSTPMQARQVIVRRTGQVEIDDQVGCPGD